MNEFNLKKKNRSGKTLLAVLLAVFMGFLMPVMDTSLAENGSPGAADQAEDRPLFRGWGWNRQEGRGWYYWDGSWHYNPNWHWDREWEWGDLSGNPDGSHRHSGDESGNPAGRDPGTSEGDISGNSTEKKPSVQNEETETRPEEKPSVQSGETETRPEEKPSVQSGETETRPEETPSVITRVIETAPHVIRPGEESSAESQPEETQKGQPEQHIVADDEETGGAETLPETVQETDTASREETEKASEPASEPQSREAVRKDTDNKKRDGDIPTAEPEDRVNRNKNRIEKVYSGSQAAGETEIGPAEANALQAQPAPMAESVPETVSARDSEAGADAAPGSTSPIILENAEHSSHNLLQSWGTWISMVGIVAAGMGVAVREELRVRELRR